MEQTHYYAIETKDNELKHYGVKGMHWGIRRYQPYTSNPRKDGKGGKFIGNKPKAKIVKDKKGSLAALAVGLTAATAVGIKAYKDASDKRLKKKAEKKRAEQAVINEQKAKDGVKYMKQKLPENAQKDIQKAASKLADAENKMDDLYWTIEDGRATKDTWKKYDEAQKKYEAEDDNYRKTLQKWDFDIDGETEHSPYFYHELAKNNNSSDSKSGLTKDKKGIDPDTALRSVMSLGQLKADNQRNRELGTMKPGSDAYQKWKEDRDGTTAKRTAEAERIADRIINTYSGSKSKLVKDRKGMDVNSDEYKAWVQKRQGIQNENTTKREDSDLESRRKAMRDAIQRQKDMGWMTYAGQPTKKKKNYRVRSK